MAKQVKAKKYPIPLVHLTGEPETGKTLLAIAFSQYLAEGEMNQTYVWPTDGRQFEYANRLGEGRVLEPDVNSVMDVAQVHKAVVQDIKDGIFKNVCLFSIDTVTHLFRKHTAVNQLRAMGGDGDAGPAAKALVMRGIVAVMMEVHKPVVAITHTYSAAKHGDLKNLKERDTISELEEARWKLAYNLKLQCFKEQTNGQEPRYGVIIEECRDRPGLQPVKLYDEPGGFYRTMPAKIMAHLFDTPAPANEPKTWEDLSEARPIPGQGDIFKQNAVRWIVEHYVEYDGQRFYAFGDPGEAKTKKNGEAGVNGAHSHAMNFYAKVAKGEYEGYPKPRTLAKLTVYLRELVDRKIESLIADYKAAKEEPQEAPAEEEFLLPDEIEF